VRRQNDNSFEVLDRGFDNFGSGLLLPDIAIDKNLAG